MAGFVSRLVACLVAVVAVLQLVHLVLLNKLESTRLHELRRLQQQQQYQHNPHRSPEERQTQVGDQNLFEDFQEIGPLQPDNINKNPHPSPGNGRGSNKNRLQPDSSNQQQQWGNWRMERAAAGSKADSPDTSDQEIRFDHLLREDQGAIMDSTGEFRIVFDVAGPHSSSSQLGSLQQTHPAAVDKEAIITGPNAQTDDFSIDDENFEGLQPPLDVTLVTYAYFQDSVESLIPLVSHWNGPLSVAIFSSTASEMQQAMDFISQARLCHGLTRKFVSFHLVFPLVETHSRKAGSSNPNNSSNSGGATINRFEQWRNEQNQKQQKRLNSINNNLNTNANSKIPISLMGKSCQSFKDHINKYFQSGGRKGGNRMHGSTHRTNISEKHNLPINLLRNVARRRVATEYSFVTNMDMIPSRDLRASFQQLIRERVGKSGGDEKKTVFVVPAFEIKSEEQIPQVKSELLSLVDKHRARPFQFDLCWKCQMYTDYETWQRDRNGKSSKLGILFEVLWKDPWEPFFISDNSVPLFDERFRHSSISRTSQLCELHVAGYKFAVLNNAFLIHRGFATAAKNQEEKGRDNDSSRAQFRQFKIELKDRYPHSTRRCY